MKSLVSLRRSLVAALAWTFLSAIALAQNRIESATQQLDRPDLRPRLETPASQEIFSLYEDEDKDVGPQNVIRQKPRHNWLESSVDLQIGSTSNATLTEDERTETSLFISTAQVALTPPAWQIPGGDLAAKVGYRHQMFRYGMGSGANEPTFNDSDFDISTLFVQWRYLYREKWLATLTADYNRLLDTAHSQEFYRELAPTLSVQRSFELTEKSSISANIAVTAHLTHTDGEGDSYDRVDESATVSYARTILPKTTFQTYYRVQFSQYEQNAARRDVLHTTGVAVSYALNASTRFHIFANFEARESRDPLISDYQKVDTGIGGAFQIQF